MIYDVLVCARVNVIAKSRANAIELANHAVDCRMMQYEHYDRLATPPAIETRQVFISGYVVINDKDVVIELGEE